LRLLLEPSFCKPATLVCLARLALSLCLLGYLLQGHLARCPSALVARPVDLVVISALPLALVSQGMVETSTSWRARLRHLVLLGELCALVEVLVLVVMVWMGAMVATFLCGEGKLTDGISMMQVATLLLVAVMLFRVQAVVLL